MNPKPISPMQSATAPGARSMRPPSASSTSADPHWLVAERLPCLATRQPAPAVSTRSSPASTFTERSRSTAARPAISPTVSPFVRSAIRNAAAWASEAFPSTISARTRDASSGARSSPLATRSIASVRTLFGIEEVAEQLFAVRREHGLGVELHALEGQLAVSQAHDHVAGPGRYLQLVRQLGVHDQRVVAADHQR